jgi:hypothetical protein
MILPFIVRFVLKPFAPAVAVAGATSLALLSGAGSTAAKPYTQCQVKMSQCSERCIMRNDEPTSTGCIARTCLHQYKNCARQAGEAYDPYGGPLERFGGKGGGGRITVNEDGETVVHYGPGSPGWGQGGSASPRPPLGGGILTGGGGGMSHQGPASTGSPVTAPSAPAAPVILR